MKFFPIIGCSGSLFVENHNLEDILKNKDDPLKGRGNPKWRQTQKWRKSQKLIQPHKWRTARKEEDIKKKHALKNAVSNQCFQAQ